MEPDLKESLRLLSAEVSGLAQAVRVRLEKDAPRSPAFWARAKDIAVILIPLVVGVAGYFVNLTLQERDSRARMVQLAIDILKTEPTQSADNRQIRQWAIEIVNRNSDVPIPAESLTTSSLPVTYGGVVGDDDRAAVADEQKQDKPWAAICKLTARDSEGRSWVSTGVAIGPRLVLTVLFNELAEGITSVEVIPGNAKGAADAIRATESHALGETVRIPVDMRMNYQLIVLPDDGRPLTAWLPVGGASARVAAGVTIATAGYPQDRGAAVLTTSAGRVLEVAPHYLLHDVDTGGGMGGAPMWLAGDPEFSVIGLHVGGGQGGKPAMRITTTIRAELDTWQKRHQ